MSARLIVMGILIAALLAAGAVSLALGASVPQETRVSARSSELAAQTFNTNHADVPAGGVVTITLGSSDVIGSWEEEAEVDNANIVEQTHNKLLLPGLKGVSGEHSQSWTFRTLKQGSTNVRVHSVPKAGADPQTRIFELTIVVTKK
jgi:hypothetical protein